MVSRDMPLFWAIFNPSDLQSPINLSLADVVVGYSESTTSVFSHATAIINLITVATFFHKIYSRILNYLFRARPSEGDFFGPISAYFRTTETNGQGMLHLYYLVWLK